jgi:ATP-dependent exoDNAse (exonuclease V) alpha subunit
MAIYSLNLGFLSRSAGRSAVGFSAYISGTRQKDERTGVVYDYRCKNDVVVSRILAPEHAPAWAKDPSTLWNEVERFEDHVASIRFRGDSKNPEKHQKSLNAKERFLNATQLAQTIMGAIPMEFSLQEAEACVEAFLTERFVSRGLVMQFAIHWEKGNPHFHGAITRRPLVRGPLIGETFSQRKDREIVSKPEHNLTRKMWEVVVNKHLELGGHDVRIDARSHADRGSPLLPTHHEGWYAQRLAERGQVSRIVADNEGIRQKNIEILCENPAALIQEVAFKRTTFTRKHLEEEIIRRVGGDETLFALLKAKVEGIEIPSLKVLEGPVETQENGATHVQSLASRFTDQLVENQEITHTVGENLNRELLFTSVSYQKQEEKLLGFADTLHHKQTKPVTEEAIRNAIKTCEQEAHISFSPLQQAAVFHLCSGPDLRILNGKAGTGKTTLLKAVALAYQEAGYRVLGTSFQGKAVEVMEQEIGISCRTLDSLRVAWEKHQSQKELVEKGRLWGQLWGRPYLHAFQRMKALERDRFSSKDVIIVDEANMIGGHLWDLFLQEAVEKGAKVLIVQDPAQLKSREAGDYGRLFAQRFGFCETSEVVRQRIAWQRDCSKHLNDHHVLEGLQPYHEKGHLKWFEASQSLHQTLAQNYVTFFLENPQKTPMALTYRNTEVVLLNQYIRQALKAQGLLKTCFKMGGGRLCPWRSDSLYPK